MKIFCTDYGLIIGHGTDKLEGIERIYTRSDNAIINSGKTLYMPAWMSEVSLMPHLVVRISRVGRAIRESFAGRYYSEVGVGYSLIDPGFITSHLQKGLNPTLGYSFDGSLMMSKMIDKDGFDFQDFNLRIIDEKCSVQSVDAPVTIPSDETIRKEISLISQYFMLKMGDIITLPLWTEYIALQRGQHVHLAIGEEEILYMGIK